MIDPNPPPNPMTGPLQSRLAGLRAEAARARAAVGLAFGGGLVIGLVILGWWLFPVRWTDTYPVDLAPEARQTYVQLVADAYADDSDLVAAQNAVAGFDAATLAATLHMLAARTDDPVKAASARTLAGGLGVSLEPSAGAPTVVPPPAAPAAAGLAGLTSALAWIALIAALGAGLALVAMWLWLRRQSAGGFAAGLPMAPAGPAFGAYADRAGDPDWVAAGLPDEGAPVDQAAGTWRARPAAPVRRVSAGTGAGVTSERIRLGQPVQAQYHADRSPAWRAWLIHDDRGDLIGGAGWQAQRVGNVNTIDLRLSDRDDFDQTTKTPIVRFVSYAAYSDPILHARLSDRRIVPAVPGQSVTLKTTDLVLEVTVDAAEPGPDADDTSLTALALSLTPRRAAPADAAALLGIDEAAVWEAGEGDGDEDLDDAFDPRPPLKFRRD